MKKRNPLEVLLFESTLTDFDFSEFNQRLEISFLATWEIVDNEIFPSYIHKKLILNEVCEFQFSAPNSDTKLPSFALSNRGVIVVEASVLQTQSKTHLRLDLEGNHHLEISCNSLEINEINKK